MNAETKCVSSIAYLVGRFEFSSLRAARIESRLTGLCIVKVRFLKSGTYRLLGCVK